MLIITDVMTKSRAAMPMTRRGLLQAMGFAFACSPPRPPAARFTSIADELARLFRWCCFGDAGLRFAGIG